MRLLSRKEYLNSVRDLLGEVTGLEATLGPGNDASAFGLLQPDITQVETEKFQKAADLIAKTIVENAESMNAIAPCDEDADGRECARSTVQNFGRRAYRAPVEDEADIERHLVLYDAGASTSYAHGVELLLRGMLQAPRFLYRVEVGTDEQINERAVRLSPYEIASRLSYAIWETLPDPALEQAAGDGGLSTQEGVEAELTRLLEDPRGASVVRRFLASLIHVADLDRVVKDGTRHPDWQSGGLRESMQAGAEAFFDHVLAKQGGTLNALFTSKTVLYNQELGPYYGVTGTDVFQTLETSEGTTSGLLTLPALLTLQAKPAESSPIHRGRFVREALLCQQLPAPPANIPKPPEVEEGVSTRERLRQHEENPACAGCHQLIDPVGFAFEHYDELGRYRETDGGEPVNTQGELILTRDIDGPVDGVVELGLKLASSAEVRECLARQWFRFALDRFEQDMDACSMKTLLDRFEATGFDLNVLPRAVVATDAFLYRRPLDFDTLRDPRTREGTP
jgi:hypothetical protein